jgi:arginase family enzyme
LEELERYSVVHVGPDLPVGRQPNLAAVVGLHGFSDTPAAPDTSFSMQMIDDWGIDDVMASALDLASRQKRALAVLFDLAVLDPAFERDRTTPGGLDPRRLFRAARAAGRRPDVAAAGFVKAASEVNLVHAVLSFCAGLAGR